MELSQVTAKILQTLTQKSSESVLLLEVASPEQLRSLIPAVLASAKEPVRFVSLVLSGENVIARPFELEDVPWPQIRPRLLSRAVEVLSLPADDIELDFQLFSSAQNKRCGLFVCMPKKQLREYLRICDAGGLIAVRITTRLLAAVESFVGKQEERPERFGLLDVSREKRIGFAAFDGRQWLLREIPYEHPEEAKGGVIQSLRSFCAKSSVKECGPIYVAGEAPVKNELTAQLQTQFGAHTSEIPKIELKAPAPDKYFFSLNLAKQYTFTLQRRRQLLMAMNIVLAVCLLLVLVLGARIMMEGNMIKQISNAI